MSAVVTSTSGLPIRLTDERWAHIVEEHTELAGLQLEVLEAVANPIRVLLGAAGERLAVRELQPELWIVAVYRELMDDGFIITAFLTSRSGIFARRRQLWP